MVEIQRVFVLNEVSVPEVVPWTQHCFQWFSQTLQKANGQPILLWPEEWISWGKQKRQPRMSSYG